MATEGFEEATFGELLSEPVRNGIYKSKEFHGRGRIFRRLLATTCITSLVQSLSVKHWEQF
jgi:hypothetical protein